MALRKKGHDIVSITLTRPGEPWYYKWLRRFYLWTQNKWFLAAVEAQWLKPISKQLDNAVNSIGPEVVLVIHGDWLAYSTFQYPTCIIHDTTFASILDYYPSFTNLTTRSIAMGNEMYQRALNRSDAAVFSADWASQSAILHYGSAKSKIFTIPFGANINPVPTATEVSEWVDVRSESQICNLVFIGTQWERKGGPEALRFVELLNRSGIASVLTVIGCAPSIPPLMKDYVRQVGYLKKESDADKEMFHDILRDAHALLLPSHAECFGCVYCEANAYALPALGRETGGVSEIIKDGVNGLLLKPGEPIDTFAARWACIWTNRTAYRKMSHNAYTEFSRRLNYDVFADSLEQVLVPIVMNRNKLSHVA
ncbi:MAG: glycosyltransferase family 4 protein [Chryseosolibacter sp.]